jgi:hypothetical protein
VSRDRIIATNAREAAATGFITGIDASRWRHSLRVRDSRRSYKGRADGLVVM